jgi:hypothetical protein
MKFSVSTTKVVLEFKWKRCDFVMVKLVFTMMKDTYIDLQKRMKSQFNKMN